jgi:hypothetical protein
MPSLIVANIGADRVGRDEQASSEDHSSIDAQFMTEDDAR